MLPWMLVLCTSPSHQKGTFLPNLAPPSSGQVERLPHLPHPCRRAWTCHSPTDNPCIHPFDVEVLTSTRPTDIYRTSSGRIFDREMLDRGHAGPSSVCARAGSVNRKLTESVGYFYIRNRRRLYNDRE